MKYNLLHIGATEIVSGVSGESESKVRDLFKNAVVSTTALRNPGKAVKYYMYAVLNFEHHPKTCSPCLIVTHIRMF
jgi:SpoVK/Ycf46/Vps4 family AAA+-type ATPase